MATITTVNFRTYFAGLRRSRRKNMAAGYLREQIARFNAVPLESVKIDRKVNDYIMSNVISRSVSLKLSVNKTATGVDVRLAEERKAPAKAPEPAKTSASKPAAGIVAEKKDAKTAQPAKKAEAKKEKASKPAAKAAAPSSTGTDQVQK